jgi:hypothetical protein
MTARRPAISVHIEQLVLDLPLTAGQAARMQASLERELARLIAGGGDVRAWRAGEAARPAVAAAAPAVLWDPARPSQLGRALARSVFASLTGPAPRILGPRGRS